MGLATNYFSSTLKLLNMSRTSKTLHMRVPKTIPPTTRVSKYSSKHYSTYQGTFMESPFNNIVRYISKSPWNPCIWCLGSWTHTLGSLLMVMYGPPCGYLTIGILMEVEPMDMPWYVEEEFEEYFETLVVCGMAFSTLMCGVFDVLNILNNLRVLEHKFENKPIIGIYSSSIHFHWYVEHLLTPYGWRYVNFLSSCTPPFLGESTKQKRI